MKVTKEILNKVLELKAVASREDLDAYLCEQDSDVVRDIMAIMYLGQPPYEDLSHMTEQQMFDLYRDHAAWSEDDLSLNVQQITQKAQLRDYLLTGCKRVGFAL